MKPVEEREAALRKALRELLQAHGADIDSDSSVWVELIELRDADGKVIGEPGEFQL